MRSEVLRRILCAAGLVGYLSWAAAPPLEAVKSSTYDWCSESCGEEESCSLECENDGGGTITCGEYHDGPVNGWCLEECGEVCSTEEACSRECLQTGWVTDCATFNGGICSNTCETTCSAMSSDGSESCLDNGGDWSTCEGYGVKVQCNDNVCVYGEVCVCSECAVYCANPDPLPSEVLEKLPKEPGSFETAFGEACEAAVTTEWAAGWTCPEWANVSEYENKTNPLCTERAALRDYYAQVAPMLREFAAQLQEQYGALCANPENALMDECRAMVAAAADALGAQSKFEAANMTPCYVSL